MSPTYASLLKLVAAYLGAEKAAGVLERQLKTMNFSSATFTQANLKELLNTVLGATMLYVADATKKDELRAKLTQMAA